MKERLTPIQYDVLDFLQYNSSAQYKSFIFYCRQEHKYTFVYDFGYQYGEVSSQTVHSLERRGYLKANMTEEEERVQIALGIIDGKDFSPRREFYITKKTKDYFRNISKRDY